MAISSGVPKRPMGMVSLGSSLGSVSHESPFAMAVSVLPGQTQFEVMPYCPPESAKHFDILSTAAFAELYAQEEERPPRSPAIDEICTSLP